MIGINCHVTGQKGSKVEYDKRRMVLETIASFCSALKQARLIYQIFAICFVPVATMIQRQTF